MGGPGFLGCCVGVGWCPGVVVFAEVGGGGGGGGRCGDDGWLVAGEARWEWGEDRDAAVGCGLGGRLGLVWGGAYVVGYGGREFEGRTNEGLGTTENPVGSLGVYRHPTSAAYKINNSTLRLNECVWWLCQTGSPAGARAKEWCRWGPPFLPTS
jgi:hypothetical protein